MLRRFSGTLQNRLLFTHMLLAVSVLFLAALMLLAIQAPMRSENMVQRMAEWLQPTVTLARGSFTDLLAANERGAEEQFFTYLRTQADAQDARILLVTQPDGTILFDTYDELTGETWEPGAPRAFEMPARRMRQGSHMQMAAEVTRGAIDLGGAPWFYVATVLLPLRNGSLDLVVLKPQPGVVGAIGESIADLPRGILIGGLAALALAIFLVSRWTARTVTHSLEPLIAGTQELAHGNLAYRVDTTNVSLVEVHDLATSFNRMADRVQQSQQAQRDFIANVSHDLKTPLTSIQGYSQALLDGTAARPDAQQRAALVISQEAQRLTNLVEEVIDLARLESGRLHLHLAPTDMNDLGAELVESFRPHADAAQVHLNWSPAPQELRFPADAARLSRALANLVDNAIKHAPPESTVTVMAERIERPAGVQFSVSDAGPGIASDELERIWERFYRVDRARTGRDGSGLGLAIVKEIVEAHGGTVGVTSTVGRGSRFWLRIPAEAKLT